MNKKIPLKLINDLNKILEEMEIVADENYLNELLHDTET